MNTGLNGYPAGSMRVSDADRDRALAELSEHYQAGRLTSEEFDERSGLALQAKTSSDLSALLTDLPSAADRLPARPADAGAAGQPAAPVQLGRPGAQLPVHQGVLIALVIVACVALAATRHPGAVLLPVAILLLARRCRRRIR
jgi:Domain of unknown function (DUF1707)